MRPTPFSLNEIKINQFGFVRKNNDFANSLYKPEINCLKSGVREPRFGSKLPTLSFRLNSDYVHLVVPSTVAFRQRLEMIIFLDLSTMADMTLETVPWRKSIHVPPLR